MEYTENQHTQTNLLFDSHHPLEHKLGVIRTLQQRADNVPTSAKGQEEEDKHLKKALRTCGYPDWTFVKNPTRSRKNNPVEGEEKKNKRNKNRNNSPGGAATAESTYWV